MICTADMRAVLFDMDGVLVDSFWTWFHTMNEVAAAFACPAIPEDRFAAAYGQGIEEDLRVFYPGRSRDELTAAYARTLPRHAAHLRANPEARDVLTWLGARGIGRAVVTNAQVDAIPGMLAAVDLEGCFDVVSGSRPGLAEKPAPDLLLDALGRLGVAPGEALMVGDTAYDEAAAAAAGVAYRPYVLRSGASLSRSLGIVAPPSAGTYDRTS